jgi:hypothetical protein
MAALGWLGPLREPARAATFALLRHVLSTDDGREILRDGLQGLTVPGSLDGPWPAVPARYARPASMPRREADPAPVFVTGRFRSGSTLIWNLFRHVESCRAYYEPLNERRWFDASHRGGRVDRTHVGVDDYWREYDGLDDLARLYNEDWIRRRLYMREHDSDLALTAYIQALIDAAPARAVLQFNRIDFRLPWLSRQFPDARVVHVYPDPREQWVSTLQSDRFPPGESVEAFAPYDRFYLLTWARDLAAHFPFLDARTAAHPYALFYSLWRLSFAFGRRYADASFSVEELRERPAEQIPRLMHAAGVRADEYDLQALVRLVLPPAAPSWPEYAADRWFREQEDACERPLATYFAGRPTESSHARGSR